MAIKQELAEFFWKIQLFSMQRIFEMRQKLIVFAFLFCAKAPVHFVFFCGKIELVIYGTNKRGGKNCVFKGRVHRLR